MAIDGFYWVIEGALAGSPRPGGIGAIHGRQGHGRWERPQPEDTEQSARRQLEQLEDDLAWLRTQGIGAILSLTEKPLPAEAVAKSQLAVLHLPVDDMTAPIPEQLDRALAFIDMQRGQGRAVAVHCKVGQGRTGTVLAAYLIRGGASVESALHTLRTLSPGAISAPEQEHALRAYANRRDWIV